MQAGVRWVVLAAGLVASGCSGAARDVPRLEVSPAVGRWAPKLVPEVDPATPMCQEMVVRNPSSEAVTARVDRISCGCTRLSRADDDRPLAVGDEIVIPAGATVPVRVALLPAATPTTQVQSAMLSCPPGGGHTLELRVELPVLAPATATPAVLSAPFHPDDGPVRKTMTLTYTTRGAGPMPAPVFDRLPSRVVVRDLRRTAGGEAGAGLWSEVWEADVELAPPGPARDQAAADYTDRLVVRHPAGDLTVPVTLRLSAGVQFSPASVDFGPPPSGRRLLLVAVDHRPFRVTGVGSDPPGVRLDPADPVAESNRHMLTLTCFPDCGGVATGVVKVTTTHPVAPEVRVPFSLAPSATRGSRSRDRDQPHRGAVPPG